MTTTTTDSAKPPLSREERLWECYKCILTGVFSQFDRPLYCDLEGPAHINWNAMLDRKAARPGPRDWSKMALDAAIYAADSFEKEETISEFAAKP